MENVSIKYVVYELNNVMGSERHKGLEKVNFDGWIQNRFDREEEAIKAIINNDKKYEEFYILKEIYITD